MKPAAVTLPEWKGVVPADWKLLEENVLGEFGLQEVLKQFLGENRAETLAAAWTGDRYALFEDPKTEETSLVFRLALDNTEDAARFFGQYSEALELKYKTRAALFRRPNYFQFQIDSGGVFLRCVGTPASPLRTQLAKRLTRSIAPSVGRPRGSVRLRARDRHAARREYVHAAPARNRSDLFSKRVQSFSEMLPVFAAVNHHQRLIVSLLRVLRNARRRPSCTPPAIPAAPIRAFRPRRSKAASLRIPRPLALRASEIPSV